MIIGITGTLGAGKGTVVEYLKQKGFTHYSARDVWNEEIDRRGLPRTRDNMVIVANELRAEHGPHYFAEVSIAKAKEHGGDAVIESIRALGEAQCIKEHGGFIWAIDADIKKRYERIVGRQSETDKVSFEKFVADEQAEFANADPNKQNISGVMKMADAVFQNNGTPKELYQQVEAALQRAGV